jgi:hypothetical protein
MTWHENFRVEFRLTLILAVLLSNHRKRARNQMNIGDRVEQVNSVWRGVLVGFLNHTGGIVKLEKGGTYIFPLSALRKSNHTTRYSQAEIYKAIAHFDTRNLDL